MSSRYLSRHILNYIKFCDVILAWKRWFKCTWNLHWTVDHRYVSFPWGTFNLSNTGGHINYTFNSGSDINHILSASKSRYMVKQGHIKTYDISSGVKDRVKILNILVFSMSAPIACIYIIEIPKWSVKRQGI